MALLLVDIKERGLQFASSVVNGKDTAPLKILEREVLGIKDIC